MNRFPVAIKSVAHWLFGHLPENHESCAVAAIGESVALMGMILGQTVALLVAVFEQSTRRPGYCVAYAAAALAPLAVLLHFWRGRVTREDGTMIHRYDSQTVIVARLCFWASVVITAAFTLLVWFGKAPGQQPRPPYLLRCQEAVRYDWKCDRARGIRARHLLDRRTLQREVPSRLPFTCSVGGPLGERWAIWRTTLGQFVDGEERELATIQLSPKSSPFWMLGYFDEVAPGGRFYLDVYLHPTFDATEQDRKAAIEDIKNGLGLTVTYGVGPPRHN